MTFLVPRTCTQALGEDRRGPARPLADFRDTPAYVLLGEPGAGKTTAFNAESGGRCLSVRNFRTLGPGPGWRREPLFIDALDEANAGDNGRTALDNLRARLNDLGRPAFRLSCREADWYAADQTELELVSPDGRIVLLHLNDLDADQIRRILIENHGVNDAMEFMAQAREHRLDDLLRNPQTLKMLAEALADGRWPESRSQTYQLACERLAIEPNPQHRNARRGQDAPVPAILETAGHLCAIQLLAGLTGFALDRDATDEEYPPLDELAIPETVARERALGSRLFIAGERVEQRRPVHRTVAEYLAASWLAARIADRGLPLVRVLALITGEDGGVVSSLRGLHAWLTVHCLSARGELIDRDPLGVVLYGDARGFPPEDKRRLLRGLQAEAERYPWFRSGDWQSSPFGALGTADMVETFAAALTSPVRDMEQQVFIGCVLDALRHGERLPVLADALLSVVRDHGYWSGNRRYALHALIHATDGHGDSIRLQTLLGDIQSGLVDDQEDELLGILLEQLYPSAISPAALINYLHRPKNPDYSGHYVGFWSRRLFETLRPEDYLLLMEGMLAAAQRLRPSKADFHLRRIIGEIWCRAIEAYGERRSPAQLLAWLNLGFNGQTSSISYLDVSIVKRIAAWLGNHPDVARSLIQYGVLQWQDQADFRQRMRRLQRRQDRLFEANPPAGFEQWYLQEAGASPSDAAAHWLFDEAFSVLLRRHGWEDFPLDTLTHWITRQPRFQPWLDEWLYAQVDAEYFEDALAQSQHQLEPRENATQWVTYVRGHYSSIADGSAHPKVFHDLALVYWGLQYQAVGDTPEQRLSNCLGADESLVRLVLTGLRRTLAREDLPDAAEIIDVTTKARKEFLIAPACLAGAHEVFEDNRDGFISLDEGILSRLIAFHLTYHLDQEPEWFDHLIHERPELIVRGFISYVPQKIKEAQENVAELYPLAHDQKYREIARSALPTLLNRFPLRVKKELHNSLELLLNAGLRHLDERLLLELIESKLKLTSLDNGQRMIWLCAALLVDPVRYEGLVAPMIQRSQSKTAILAEFLRRAPREPAGRKPVPHSTAALLVRLLGPTCELHWGTGAQWVSANEETAKQVASLIDQLGSRPDPEAPSALESLLGEKPLAAWHERIRQALESQRLSRREALFRYPTTQDLVRALNNLEPAGPADLRALVVDHLESMADKLRHGDTNGWRSFWDGDQPALENDCRDRLLDLLRPKLEPLGIEAQKEGYFAQDKRADIRVSYRAGAHIVPIEIKRDSHRDLWRALRDQLIARYTPDPGARGNGIYLALWFGGNGMSTPPTGPTPRSAEALKAALLAQLKPHERPLVSVVVLDCSQPPAGTPKPRAPIRKSADQNP